MIKSVDFSINIRNYLSRLVPRIYPDLVYTLDRYLDVKSDTIRNAKTLYSTWSRIYLIRYFQHSAESLSLRISIPCRYLRQLYAEIFVK